MSHYRGSAANQTFYENIYESASPTPSPHHYPDYYQHAYDRPATRCHTRTKSSAAYMQGAPPPARPPTAHPGASPRYNSSGQYATVNVSDSRSTRRFSSSGGSQQHQHHRPPPPMPRRSSQSYYRTSDRRGESDEDEWFEDQGVTYVLPAQSRSKRWSSSGMGMGARDYFLRDGLDTDYHYYYAQAQSPREPPQSPLNPDSRRSSHSRRSSTSTPLPRSQTANPFSSFRKQSSSSTPKKEKSESSRKAAPEPIKPTRPQATEKDAKKCNIPANYSLVNWDPTETPIILAGSVFDANSLGKWIYDWTSHVHKLSPGHGDVDQAGELWLLLINLSGKIKRAEQVMPEIRSAEKREMVEDFIESGERLNDKLRKLLKRCEGPMLETTPEGNTKMGKEAGKRFVKTMFGPDYELANTQKFVASVRLWNLRFDANCEEILLKPSK